MTKGTPEWRFSIHLKSSRNKNHNYHFANAIRKYGPDAFSIETIDTSKTENGARNLESFYIDKERSCDPLVGYNMTKGGEGGITDEVRIKISRALKGKKRTEEMRKKISESKKGIKLGPRTEEHRRKMSKILKGRFMGDESSTWKTIPVNEILFMYESGMSSRSLGEKFGVSSSTILSRIKMAGGSTRKRWFKCKENLEKHPRLTGENCSWSKLSSLEAREIKDLCDSGLFSQLKISKIYGVSQACVGSIFNGKTWKSAFSDENEIGR